MSDDLFLAQAVSLARGAIGLSEPNPRVGCVLVAAGQVIGQGHTQQAGGPHAEVMALRDAQARGHSVADATAYVTLEPCSHHGRTPPCADALVRERLGRVVVAALDPNPLVGGQGIARLQAAGIQVDVIGADHPSAVAARELNIGFLSRMVRKLPWVRLKMAGSLDGRTALNNGQSKWITGEEARADGQAWRARAGAVLTGIGTVLADDPRLDVRAIAVHKQPMRVVLDAHWRTPPASQLLALPGGTLVYGLDGDAASAQARARLQQAGAEVALSGADAGSAGRHLDLGPVLQDLARRGVNELHVEAGARLNAAFIAGGWVDEYLVYLAPKLIGPGRGLADLSELAQLADAVALRFHEVQMIGSDLRVLARPPGRDRF
ncbi:MAG: bifunctional diaminohydroxyphosphoribosylaminopyrimidine deaminase/5-amino-6-(5-phosphoribosylamino)uracil reductase RibD [Aquabacterium sp.]